MDQWRKGSCAEVKERWKVVTSRSRHWSGFCSFTPSSFDLAASAHPAFLILELRPSRSWPCHLFEASLQCSLSTSSFARSHLHDHALSELAKPTDRPVTAAMPVDERLRLPKLGRTWPRARSPQSPTQEKGFACDTAPTNTGGLFFFFLNLINPFRAAPFSRHTRENFWCPHSSAVHLVAPQTVQHASMDSTTRAVKRGRELLHRVFFSVQ